MKLLIASIILLCLSCGAFAAPPKEPAGKKVSLNLMDRKGLPSLGLAWKTRGLAEELEGRYQEALYCFHQAQKAWPEKDPNPALGLPWQSPQQFVSKEKAALYIRMREPQLALYWSGQMKPEKEEPLYRSLQARSLYMLGKYKDAEQFLEPGPSVMRAALLHALGSKDSGLEMLKKTWPPIRNSYKDEALKSYKEVQAILNLKWMDYPDEVQALIKKIDPTAPGSQLRF